MKLLNILRKLGIVRFGQASGIYKSYQEMPDELMFDNTYDKKKDLINHGTEKNSNNNSSVNKQNRTTKISGFLFWLLVILSSIITLFFSLMIGTGVWLYTMIIILLFFLVILYRFKMGVCLFKSAWLIFAIYFFLSLIVVFIGVPSSKQADNGSKSQPLEGSTADSNQSPAAETEWINYTGVKSPLLTFRYPKSYTVEDSGTSILVFSDKENNYLHHVTFTVLDFDSPTSKDCQGFAKMVAAGFKNGEIRYAKTLNIGGLMGCEYGMNSEQSNAKVYGLAYTFNSERNNFGINAYASQKPDLEILKQIMDSFKLK